jgi:hypothetical protein
MATRLFVGWECQACKRHHSMSENAIASLDEFQDLLNNWRARDRMVMVVCAPEGCGAARWITAEDLMPIEIDS